MKEIPLTQGKVALVDDEDFDRLSQHKWYALKHNRTFYAVRELPRLNGRQEKLLMHREILGLHFGDGIGADHRDVNGLNNQRNNLRICSQGENNRNKRMHSRAKHSRFKGVTLDRRAKAKRWRAGICLNRIKFDLGHFYTEEAAALSYNEGAKLYFKDFARLNVLE